jgi:hypothetical protein
VLSIGFLGMSTLLVRSMTNNNSAMAHTQTSVVTYAILDSLRANRTSRTQRRLRHDRHLQVDSSTPSCSLSTNLTGGPIPRFKHGVWALAARHRAG